VEHFLSSAIKGVDFAAGPWQERSARLFAVAAEVKEKQP
jgi:hypothetical protein